MNSKCPFIKESTTGKAEIESAKKDRNNIGQESHSGHTQHSKIGNVYTGELLRKFYLSELDDQADKSNNDGI